MEWIDVIVSILVGLSTAIPLIATLIKYVKKAIKEKNWNDLLDLVMRLMAEAEKKFETGAERKEWVLVMVKASADTINYDINLNDISALIDGICELTKQVNTDQVEENIAK